MPRSKRPLGETRRLKPARGRDAVALGRDGLGRVHPPALPDVERDRGHHQHAEQRPDDAQHVHAEALQDQRDRLRREHGRRGVGVDPDGHLAHHAEGGRGAHADRRRGDADQAGRGELARARHLPVLPRLEQALRAGVELFLVAVGGVAHRRGGACPALCTRRATAATRRSRPARWRLCGTARRGGTVCARPRGRPSPAATSRGGLATTTRTRSLGLTRSDGRRGIGARGRRGAVSRRARSGAGPGRPSSGPAATARAARTTPRRPSRWPARRAASAAG